MTLEIICMAIAAMSGIGSWIVAMKALKYSRQDKSVDRCDYRHRDVDEAIEKIEKEVNEAIDEVKKEMYGIRNNYLKRFDELKDTVNNNHQESLKQVNALHVDILEKLAKVIR